LTGEIADPCVFRALGRLQIYRRQGRHLQSLHILTLSQKERGRSDLFKIVKMITDAGRVMVKESSSERLKRKKKRSGQ
jgi:hypothetical protein